MIVTFSYHLCGVLEALGQAGAIVLRDPSIPLSGAFVTQTWKDDRIVKQAQRWRNWRKSLTL
jgi:hypothetical protein